MNDLIGLSSDDVPQILTFGEVYTLPFGKGQRFGGNSSGLVDKIIGNWKISGIASYQSGRPMTMFVNNNLGGFLFNVAKFPNIVSGQNPVNSASFHDPFTQRYYNSAAFSIPAPLSFGNSPRTNGNIRGFPYYNEDASIYKDTYFGEQKYVRLAVEGGNIFNRVDFCSPNSNVQSGGFGQTFTQCNIPRRIQIGLQVFF